MNVTLKLPDDLCRQARHRAVDESKSLSTWIAYLVAAKLRPAPNTQTLLQALGDESLADGNLELPDRRTASHRPLEFQ